MADVPGTSETKAAADSVQPFVRFCFRLGVASLLSILAGIISLILAVPILPALLMLVGILTAPLTLILSAIAFFRKGNAASKRKAVWGGALAFAVILVGGVGMVTRLQSRAAASASAAAGTLRTLNAALITYASDSNRGFPDTLNKLGPPPPGQQPDENNADLLDSLTVERVVGGGGIYRFTYTPGPRDQDRRITTYTITARPLQFGSDAIRSFFMDESGVVRLTDEDREPTAQDGPL